jgi:hypothetical protein
MLEIICSNKWKRVHVMTSKRSKILETKLKTHIEEVNNTLQTN